MAKKQIIFDYTPEFLEVENKIKELIKIRKNANIANIAAEEPEHIKNIKRNSYKVSLKIICLELYNALEAWSNSGARIESPEKTET